MKFSIQHVNLIVYFILTDSSTNTTENPSPSLSPPSSVAKSPQPHPAFMQNVESDDDGQEIIEEDDDSTDRQNDSSSPQHNSSMQKRKKKTRTVFSRAQVFQLESTFDIKR